MAESRPKLIRLGAPALKIIEGSRTEAPTFSATVAEQVAIRRFLDFAQADIKFQFDALNRDRRQKRDVLMEAQATAIILGSYLENLRKGIDEMKIAISEEPA
jgi:hypothetical protein